MRVLAATLRSGYRRLVPPSLRDGVRAILRRWPAARRWLWPVATPGEPSRSAARDWHFELRLPTPPRGGPRTSPILGQGPPTIRIVADRSLYVPKVLARSGLAGYEPETISCFVAAIGQWSRPLVFDVGANVGVFTLVAAALSDAELVGFEPAPELAQAMGAILAANSLPARVETLALGAEEGSATLYLSSVTDSSNSLRAGFRPSRGSVTVPVETLDGYCRRTGRWPVLLKLDTETTEPDVLSGAEELLQRRPWLICEVLPGRTEAALTTILAPLHYHWYQLTEDCPPERRAVLKGSDRPGYHNWLFAPEPPTVHYWESVGAWRRALAECAPIPDTRYGGAC